MIDIIVEFLFEVFAEGFISLCEEFVPQRLRFEKTRRIITVAFITLATVLFAGLIVGTITLIVNQGQSLPGWVAVGLGVLYILSGVLLKLFRSRK